MNFQWNEAKNRENILKHGIDVEDVKEVFDQPVLVKRDNREDYGEVRWLGIGMMRFRIIVIIYTERNVDTVRIISARKATKREVKYYEKSIKD